MSDLNQVIIYTDGACIGNPGLGGYAAVRISPLSLCLPVGLNLGQRGGRR
jgi:hypothetical protein